MKNKLIRKLKSYKDFLGNQALRIDVPLSKEELTLLISIVEEKKED